MKLLPIPEEKEYDSSLWVVTHGSVGSIGGKVGVEAKTADKAKQLAEDMGVTDIITVEFIRGIDKNRE